MKHPKKDSNEIIQYSIGVKFVGGILTGMLRAFHTGRLVADWWFPALPYGLNRMTQNVPRPPQVARLGLDGQCGLEFPQGRERQLNSHNDA